MKASFFTDEDIFAAVATALRAAGFDAISTPEAGRLGELDEPQLEWAAANGRVLVTFNVADFARLHSDRLSGKLERPQDLVWNRCKDTTGRADTNISGQTLSGFPMGAITRASSFPSSARSET